MAGSAVHLGHRIWFLATDSQIFPLSQTLGLVDNCHGVFLNNQFLAASMCGDIVRRDLGAVFANLAGDVTNPYANDALAVSFYIMGFNDQGILWGRRTWTNGFGMMSDPFVADFTGIYREFDAGYADRAKSVPLYTMLGGVVNDRGQLATNLGDILAIYDPVSGYTPLPQSGCYVDMPAEGRNNFLVQRSKPDCIQ